MYCCFFCVQPRFYMTLYKMEMVLLLFIGFALLLSIFIKNILRQIKGRNLGVILNYFIKVQLILVLIGGISAMHTVSSTNSFEAYIPISILTIPVSLLLAIFVSFVFIRELYTVFFKN